MSTLPLHQPITTQAPATHAKSSTRFIEPQTIYAQSVAAMTALFIVGIAVPTWVAMGDAGFAIGLALFSAFWGGPGFGVMAGGARVAMQEARLEAEQWCREGGDRED